MLNTTRYALALCLSVFLTGAAGAQTPPPSQPPPQTEPQTPPQTPPPSEPQTPPQTPPSEPQTPPPGEPQTPPQTPPGEPQTEPQKPPQAEPQSPPLEPPMRAPSRRRTRFFVSGNGGYQVIDTKFATSTTFEAFEETATLTSDGELSSEPLFDVSAGYMVTDRLGVSVGFSTYVTETDVNIVATVPHPIFFDRPRVATYTAAGVKNSSPAIHLNAVYFIPFTTNIEFYVSGGPSIVMVNQDVVRSANLQPEQPPFAVPNITGVNVEAVSKTTVGFNIGAEANYMVTPRYGAGLTLRYLIASADIDGLTDNLKVSGFQILGGVRLRF